MIAFEIYAIDFIYLEVIKTMGDETIFVLEQFTGSHDNIERGNDPLQKII